MMNFPRWCTVYSQNLKKMESVFAFLQELARNNNRDWFNEHKNLYQESLEEFRVMAGEILEGITRFDPSLAGIEARDSIFRIYKDTRFSRDKTPYKTHFGLWMTRGGRKSTNAGYYFHLEPKGSFMAAGVHSPPAEQLKLIRQEIIFNSDSYYKIIRDPGLQERFQRGGKDDMLKKGPAGFPKDSEHLEELRYKHYIFLRNYTDGEVCSQGFAGILVNDFRELAPLVAWMNQAMSYTGNE